MNTVCEILLKARETKDKMKLKSVAVVFDQAIYAKAVEIMWKHGDLAADIVPRLGTFHTVCVLLSWKDIWTSWAKGHYHRIWYN